MLEPVQLMRIGIRTFLRPHVVRLDLQELHVVRQLYVFKPCDLLIKVEVFENIPDIR